MKHCVVDGHCACVGEFHYSVHVVKNALAKTANFPQCNSIQWTQMAFELMQSEFIWHAEVLGVASKPGM
jgi:hypothetical protein